MKIGILGGGPAGLYFALLMKRDSPAHEIRVVEQNPAGATYGWGVVFSDRALSYLQDGDPDSYAEIEKRLQTWDEQAIVHRGRKVRIDGYGFSGIARLELLRILQEHCRRRGVAFYFDTRLTDLAPFADCDLIVGADGVSSLVREFVAHHYRYSATASTFIVECDANTWVKAGFEAMSDEQSRRYCEQVFSDDLGGHPLLTNRSKWLNFKAVINRRWSYKNVVLIGDALRSVHFSIGSGTRSALEDAIALYQACTAHDDVKTALKAFEWARRPTVEQLLAIAARSSRWYEHFRKQMYLDPLPFAYDYMTRSGKIDHESLRKRSPNFIAEYDAYITGSVNNANNAKYG